MTFKGVKDDFFGYLSLSGTAKYVALLKEVSMLVKGNQRAIAAPEKDDSTSIMGATRCHPALAK